MFYRMQQLYNGLLKKNNGYKSLNSSGVKKIKKKKNSIRVY